MCRRLHWIVFRVVLAAIFVSFATPFLAATTSEHIEQALRDLGDERFEVREKATQELFSAGLAAMPALRRAAVGDDPEVRFRAERILGRFARGVFADTPADVSDLADRYAGAEETERNSILAELARKGGYGYVVLTKLAEQEQDLWLKGQIAQLLAEHVDALPQSAAVLVQQGDSEGAERLLATGAGTGNDVAVRAYAALLGDQGKLAGAIKELQARVGRGEAEGDAANAARMLAMFYRAAGELEHAAAVAEKAGDSSLLETIALERRDWKKLAGLLQDSTKNQPPDLRRLGFLATVQRYAGDHDGFEKTLADILEIHKANPGNYWPVATTLLLNDRLAEATELLAGQKRYVTAFDLYCFAGKFDEALALLGEARGEEHADVPALMAKSARIRWRMGENQKATALLDEASGLLGKSVAAYIAIAEVQREMGRSDPAMAATARGNVAKILRIIDVGQGGGGSETAAEKLFEKLYGEQGSRASAWWTILAPMKTLAQPVDPETAWDAAVETLERVMENRLTPEEWQALFEKVDDPVTRPSHPMLRLWRLEQLLDGLDAAGQTAVAEKCFARLHDAFTGARDVPRELCLYVPKLQVRQKQWLAAVEDCKICAANVGAGPDLLWLQGWALHEAGEQKAGDALMSQARRTTFGDDQRLETLAAMMEDLGHAADAMEVRGEMLKVGAPRSLYFYDACWRLGTAVSKDDPARAAAFCQLYALAVPDAGAVFGGELWYVMVPRTARVQQARALYHSGKIAEAMADFRLLDAQAPLDLEVALDAVPELKKLGHEAAAREVFDLVYKPLDAFCGKHPEGAFHHNEIAWLAARCDYDLDAALKHALRAVELQPRETNSIDTLAEVYFRRGDRDKAVALMKQCESIEPNQPRHRRRREEFEKGVVGGTGEE